MKRGLFVLMLALVGVMSCKREYPMGGNSDGQRVVITAEMNSFEETHTLFLGLSEAERIGCLKPGASIYCTVSGEEKKLAKVREDDYSLYSEYTFKAPLKAGDRVMLDVECDGSRASVDLTVPQNTLRVTGVETLQRDGVLYFSIGVRELPHDGRSWYRLETMHTYRIGLPDIPVWFKTVSYSIDADVSKSSVMSGGPLASAEGASDFFGTYMKNTWQIFDNSQFKNGEAVLNISVPKSALEPSNNWGAEYGEGVMIQHLLELRLYAISFDAYRYYNALNFLEDSEYLMQNLTEPVCLPSNVDGGLGFVNASEGTSHLVLVSTGPMK